MPQIHVINAIEVPAEMDDGLKVLGEGFPPPIVVHPGRYEVVRSSP